LSQSTALNFTQSRRGYAKQQSHVQEGTQMLHKHSRELACVNCKASHNKRSKVHGQQELKRIQPEPSAQHS